MGESWLTVTGERLDIREMGVGTGCSVVLLGDRLLGKEMRGKVLGNETESNVSGEKRVKWS